MGLVALKDANIIDVVKGSIVADGTVMLKDDKILEVGQGINIPCEARAISLEGKYIIPGLVDMHGHFFGFAHQKIGNLLSAYPQLYLAGGVTSVRSPGEYDPEAVFKVRDQINRGERIGCRIFTAGPYFDHAPSVVKWFDCIEGVDAARKKFVQYKNDMDFVKVYSNIQEDELVELIRLAHANNLKIAGHLGSVTAGRAIELGLDCIEHALFHMSEFTELATGEDYYRNIANVDLTSAKVASLLEAIVENDVAIVPTVVIFQIMGEFEDVDSDWMRFLSPEARLQQQQIAARFSGASAQQLAYLEAAIDKQLEFIRMLHDRGAKVFCGTDPTLIRLLPGKALHREMKLFVDAGLSPLEVLQIATHKSAQELGVDEWLGSIEPGKVADLVILEKNPLIDIKNVGTISAIFKGGVSHNPNVLLKSLEGLLGTDVG